MNPVPDSTDRGPCSIQPRPTPDTDLDTLADHRDACECCGRAVSFGRSYCHRCGGRSPFPRRRVKFQDQD